MLRVLIVDDEPLARENLRVLLQEQSDIEIVGECANAIEAIGAVHKLRPDVLFLDIQMEPVERYMTANEGTALLMEMEANAGESGLMEAIAVGIARAGAPDASVKADLLPRLQGYSLGGPLHILIIPARLHFMEAEALRILADAPADAVQC